jgi:hypothetical protein
VRSRRDPGAGNTALLREGMSKAAADPVLPTVLPGL